MEIVARDAGATYGHDEEADILFVDLANRTLNHSDLNEAMDKVAKHNPDGIPVEINFLYCFQGATMDDIPDALRELVQAAADDMNLRLKERSS